MLARALDAWWDDLGRPDPYVVVEAGAGVGSLARAVVAAAPTCAPALHYVLVERAEALRDAQGRQLPLEPAREVLGPILPGDADDGPHPTAGTGPVLTALAELPAGRFTGVVVANELLDNLPFRLLERRAGEWLEVRVGEQDGGLVELLLAAPPEAAAEADRFAPDAPDGGRVPLQHAAMAWVRDAVHGLRRGRVVTFDYADTSASLATRPWRNWVRTYRGHARGASPLERVGEQDVTCEVAVDQVAAARRIDLDRSQAEFLRSHGIDALAEEARSAWQGRAHIGDLEAMKARARLTEAAALTDPGGLGAFRCLEWVVG